MKVLRNIVLCAFILAWSATVSRGQDIWAEIPGTPVLSDTTYVNDSLVYILGQGIPEGYELVDTVVFVPSDRVDQELKGKNIFYLLPTKAAGGAADVHVYQSANILAAMNKSFENNISRRYTGYRVRIFFDNKQTARQESEDMVKAFEAKYPGIPAYRSYVNPYFKITVGDFRTKSEAVNFLQTISKSFPKAFIVKENIEFPLIDRDSLGRMDTLWFLRKSAEVAGLTL